MTSHETRAPRAFASRTVVDRPCRADVGDVVLPPVYSARRISRPTMISSATSGHAGKPEGRRDEPFVHHRRLCVIARSCACWITGLSNIADVLQSARRMISASWTGSPSSENADGPRFRELGQRGELLPLPALRDGSDGIHVHEPVERRRALRAG